MARSQVVIAGVRYQGMPTAELSSGELERIRDLRVAGYSEALPEVDRKNVAPSVDNGMDTWCDANAGVRDGTLNPAQRFMKTAVWLAYGKDNLPIAEVLSANNVSGGGTGLMGSVIRGIKMAAPVIPTVHDRQLGIQHSPWRVVREVFGPNEVVAGLMYMTAAHVARPHQPMSAYMWEEEQLSQMMPEWGYRIADYKTIAPLDADGPAVTEQNWRAPSAKHVAQTILSSAPGLAANLSAVGAVRSY